MRNNVKAGHWTDNQHRFPTSISLLLSAINIKCSPEEVFNLCEKACGNAGASPIGVMIVVNAFLEELTEQVEL